MKKTTEISQKPLSIVIGINSLTSTPYMAYSNHISAMHKLGRWAERGKHNIALYNPERMSIDRMRNQCAKIAIESGADYLLFWDDDVLVPLDFIDSLLSCNADIAAADVIIRGYPFNHMAFVGDGKQGLVPIPNLAPLVKKQKSNVLNVDAVGFSLCLIKTSLLKKMTDPYFITGLRNTEDIYFCLKAREIDKNVSIKLDTRVQCGHILWQEVISTENKKAFAIYQETMNPGMKQQHDEQEKAKKSATDDRGTAFLKNVSAKVKAARIQK